MTRVMTGFKTSPGIRCAEQREKSDEYLNLHVK